MPPLGLFPRGFFRRKWSLLDLRRFSQALFFILFVFLLLRTEFRGSARIGYPVNAFFQLDPYLASAVALANRALPVLFWPALLTLAVALVLGRAFCGWFCPMGSLLDFLGGRIRGRRFLSAPPLGKQRHLKYYLLAAAMAAAALGFQGAWLADPFSILGRAFSVSVIPAANLALTSLFDFVWAHARPLAAVTEPLYALLRRFVLTFDQQHFLWGGASLLLLAALAAAEAARPRFWCTYLCPLGAALSLFSRYSLMRRRVSRACTDCGACYGRCPLGLIEEENHRESSRECSACLVCRRLCPHRAVEFPFGRDRAPDATPDLSRRRLVAGTLAGMAAVPFFRISPPAGLRPPGLIRPPGAAPEPAFLEKCVRCGSCMKVCMGNAIHPALLEAGPEGLMTPMMVYRLGYCEYNCTLCGQVCPTGAIRRLDLEEKHRVKTGEAFIDQNRCLPWASAVNCMVCEEHCPVAEKAIRFEETEVRDPEGRTVRMKRPKVVRELCIGCGICETKCPLPGRAAIAVTSSGESRRGEAS